MELFEKSIKPTLYDFGGEVLVTSKLRRKKSRQFFLQYFCTDPQYGFHEYRATTMDNPDPFPSGCVTKACWLTGTNVGSSSKQRS